MSKACARHLHEQGATLIFPHSANLDGDLSTKNEDFAVVNKILASVQSGNAGVVEALASGCRETVQAWLVNEYRHMERNVRHLIGEDWHYDEKLALQQIENAFEFHAAWAPTQNGDYKASRKRVEEIIAARKSLRDFRWYQGSNRPKSSLDGFRET